MFENCITIVCRDVPVYALLLLSLYAYLLVLHCAFVDIVFWHVVYSFYSCVHSRKIWSVEDLETLPAGSKPRTSHHRSPGGERRRKKGSARRSSLKGRERVFVNQTNIGTFQRQLWENFWETGWSAYGLFQVHLYHLELNWTAHKYANLYSVFSYSPCKARRAYPKMTEASRYGNLYLFIIRLLWHLRAWTSQWRFSETS